MRLKLYNQYDNSRKNGIMIQPDSYFDELKLPYKEKLYETKLKIKGHLEAYFYTDNAGVKRSACWVSSSHGKDSIVVVHLTIQCCKELGIPMIQVFLNNTLNLYPEEPAYWKFFNKRYNIENEFMQFLPPKDKAGKQITVKSIREKNNSMENFRNKGQRMKNEETGNMVLKYSPDCCEQLKRLSVNEYLMKDGLHLKCSFDGRRAIENRNRSRNILQRGCTYETDFERPRVIRSFLPIAYWTDEDRDQYILENFIPTCPAYKIHNIERMGCQSCVAYKSWIINQCTDHTDLGSRTLRMQLEFMRKTEPDRLKDELKWSMHQIHLNKIKINPKAMSVLTEFSGQQTLLMQ